MLNKVVRRVAQVSRLRPGFLLRWKRRKERVFHQSRIV
jgi:hypothetical protein